MHETCPDECGMTELLKSEIFKRAKPAASSKSYSSSKTGVEGEDFVLAFLKHRMIIFDPLFEENPLVLLGDSEQLNSDIVEDSTMIKRRTLPHCCATVFGANGSLFLYNRHQLLGFSLVDVDNAKEPKVLGNRLVIWMM